MITYLKGFPYDEVKLTNSINNSPEENYPYEDETFYRNTFIQIDVKDQNYSKQDEDGRYENIIVNTIVNKKIGEYIKKYTEKNISIYKKFHRFKLMNDLQKLFEENRRNSYFQNVRLKMKTFIDYTPEEYHLMTLKKYCGVPKTKRAISVLARWKLFSMLFSENPYYTPRRVFAEKTQRNIPRMYLKNNVLSAETRTFVRPLGAPLRWG